MMVLHVARSEQDTCIAQQHVSGRVRPAGSPLTSPPDPDRTRRTRRTAGPVRRERCQPGPGSAQEPAEPPLREARPPSDAVPHASRSCRQYTSTGWRRQRALPGGKTSVLLGEICVQVARGSSQAGRAYYRVRPVGAPAAHVRLEFFVAAGSDLNQAQSPVQWVGALGMLADPLGPLACRLRVLVLQLCGVCVDLVGVRAHGGRGIAAVELSEESLGVALVGHVDEGLLLDLFPTVLADFRAAFFLLMPSRPQPGRSRAPDEGGQLVLQGGFAGIALAEDRVLLPSPCQRHLQPAGGREALVHGRALRSGQVISLGDEGTAWSPALVQFADGDQCWMGSISVSMRRARGRPRSPW